MNDAFVTGARRMSMSVKGGNGSPSKPATSKGAISISGITLPLKPDFVRMLNTGGHDGVHYFLCLVKYRAQVIATQMLSTVSSDSLMEYVKGAKITENTCQLMIQSS